MRYMPNSFLWSICCCCALAGCAHTPKPSAEKFSFAAPAKYAADNNAFKAGGEIRSLAQWLHSLGDEALLQWVERGLNKNYDLAMARANVQKAQATVSAAQQALLPSASVQVGRTDTRVRGQATSSSFEQILSVSWEIDLWGKRIKELKSETLKQQASKALLDQARRSLVASTARLWFSAISARQRQLLVHDSIKSLTKKKRIMALHYRQGLESIDALELLDNELRQLQLRQNSLQTQVKAQARALQMVAGEYPDGALSLPENLPRHYPSIQQHPPSALLQHRPDVLAAWLTLKASEAAVAAAVRQRWLPSIGLSARGVESGNSWRDVLVSPSLWTLGLAIIKNIFSSQESLQLGLSRAEVVHATATYAITALRAWEEVEKYLLEMQLSRDSLDKSSDSVASAKRLYRFAQRRFSNGLTNARTLLDQHRLLLNQQIQQIELHEQSLRNQVDLLLALGVPTQVAVEQGKPPPVDAHASL